MSLPSAPATRDRLLRRAAPYVSLSVVVAASFWPLFARMARASGDFEGHLRLAREMLRSGAPASERFGFELVTLLAAGFSDSMADLVRGATIVATVAMVAKALISARWLARDLAPWRAAAIALLVLFLAPITFAAVHPLQDDRSAVHLGQMSGLILHNPTTVLVFPLALALFVASWHGRARSSAALAAVQCFVKPNFVAAWVPVAPLLELWRGRKSGRPFARTARTTALILAPAIGVLGWQFLASEDVGTLIIAPWRHWQVLSPNIPLSIARSLAFPVLLALLHFRDVRRRPEQLFAWGIFAVAFVQYALLYLEGADYPGNWSWGRYLSIYVVFLLSVEVYAHVALRPESWRGWRAVANGALGAVFLLHLWSGLVYYSNAVRYGFW